MDEKFLAHHGVKGMRWGVRRYQNEDGTYTDAGRKRYGKQAARKYYKIDRLKRQQETTESFRKYQRLGKSIRKTQTRYDRKVVGLTQTDIDKGRLAVSRFRSTAKKVRIIAGGATAATGAAFIASNPMLGAAAIGFGAGNVIGGAHRLPYYQMESTMLKRRISG